MAKIKLEYEERNHIIEVDGVEYVVPARTPELEEKLKKHDENIEGRTEYENNIELLNILFGKENTKKMFPTKKDTNLDKLSKCAKISIELFMYDFNEIQKENIEKKLGKVKPILDLAKDVNDIASAKKKRTEKQ